MPPPRIAIEFEAIMVSEAQVMVPRGTKDGILHIIITEYSMQVLVRDPIATNH